MAQSGPLWKFVNDFPWKWCDSGSFHRYVATFTRGYPKVLPRLTRLCYVGFGKENLKPLGGIPTHLKNISQLGWLFPIRGKINNVPNHQPGKSCVLTTPLVCRLSESFSLADPLWSFSQVPWSNVWTKRMHLLLPRKLARHAEPANAGWNFWNLWFLIHDSVSKCRGIESMIFLCWKCWNPSDTLGLPVSASLVSLTMTGMCKRSVFSTKRSQRFKHRVF